MKKLIALLALILVFFFSGCGAGTAQTSAEVGRQHKNVIDVSVKQLNDDLNKLFHTDHPSQLSERYVR